MLADLCLCALVLFSDRGWSRLDTSFLDMDPPMLSWSMTDAEFTEWEEAEMNKITVAKMVEILHQVEEDIAWLVEANSPNSRLGKTITPVMERVSNLLDEIEPDRVKARNK